MMKEGLKSIAELDGCRFSVPSYQRGYRWGQREVRALLEDIWDFWKDNKANGGGRMTLIKTSTMEVLIAIKALLKKRRAIMAVAKI